MPHVVLFSYRYLSTTDCVSSVPRRTGTRTNASWRRRTWCRRWRSPTRSAIQRSPPSWACRVGFVRGWKPSFRTLRFWAEALFVQKHPPPKKASPPPSLSLIRNPPFAKGGDAFQPGAWLRRAHGGKPILEMFRTVPDYLFFGSISWFLGFHGFVLKQYCLKSRIRWNRTPGSFATRDPSWVDSPFSQQDPVRKGSTPCLHRVFFLRQPVRLNLLLFNGTPLWGRTYTNSKHINTYTKGHSNKTTMNFNNFNDYVILSNIL